jgi:hypothetical protein
MEITAVHKLASLAQVKNGRAYFQSTGKQTHIGVTSSVEQFLSVAK